MRNNRAPIRVMQLIGSGGLYGAERWILALMRALGRYNICSVLVNLIDEAHGISDVVHAARQRGLEAIDFETGGKFNPLAVFRLSKWAREYEISIIHGHGFKSDLLGLISSKLCGCRMVTTPHGWSLENDIKLKLYEKLDRITFRFVDKVCPLSATIFEGLKGHVDNSRLKFISNGVDLDEIECAKSVQRDSHGSFVIGYIGRLIESKDISTLIEAVHSLIKERNNIKLWIIGDGPLLPTLQNMCIRLNCTKHIKFLGYRHDAVSWLKVFDLFVLPSRSEGIPRCIMEAMAASIPVIASDIPGNRDIVNHFTTGLLFQVGNSKQLADHIQYIIANPESAASMSRAGYINVSDKYSNKVMAEDYAALYKELMPELVKL